MRLLVDAMCAEYGGIRTYVDHLLGQWSSYFPDDELHIVLPTGSTMTTGPHTRHELGVGRPVALRRPLLQSTALPRLVRRLQPDAVLVTVPSTTLRRLPVPTAVVILDLRHELRPEQFSRGRRLLRRISYGRSYAIADAFLSISQRSLDDLHQLHPDTRNRPGHVIHLGGDHVLGWPPGDRSGPAVSFAHHTNKNPDLLLEAWALLAARGGDVPSLTLLGLGGAGRERIQPIVDKLGLGPHVHLAPFLPEPEFQQVMADADMVVFPSDFEGFGLPVVEGMALGKPVVIGPETATMEVAGGHASVAADWTPAALADAISRAREMTPQQIDTAREWGRSFTWERTIRQTRGVLAALAGLVDEAASEPTA